MTIPRQILIDTCLTDEQIDSAVAFVIESASRDITDKLLDYYGVDNGGVIKCDAALAQLMDGFAPGRGRWSDCFCPDIDSATIMSDSLFAGLLRRLVHIERGSIIIEERNQSTAFQEEYDYLYHHLAVLASDNHIH